MAYEFKRLSDVDVVETALDTANVLIEENGVIKKISKNSVGGAGGVSSWNDLTDKPFSEMKESITWDGNTEGLVCVENLYKVSDAILSDEILKNSTITLNTGESLPMSFIWEEIVAAGYVTDDIALLPESVVVCVRKSGATFLELTFEETGVYFVKNDEMYTSELTLSSQIKTIDAKFLPFVVITVKGDIINSEPEISCNTSYDECLALIEQGTALGCINYYDSEGIFEKSCAIVRIRSSYDGLVFEDVDTDTYISDIAGFKLEPDGNISISYKPS